MRIGAQIGLWGKLHAALEDVSTVRLNGIETFGLDQYYADPSEFSSVLSKFHIKLSGIYHGGDFITPDAQKQELKKATKVIQFLRSVEGEFLILNSGSARKNHGYPVSSYSKLAETMNKVGRIGSELGIKVACHPHVGSMVETRKQLDLLMSSLDPDLVSLCPHAAHFLYTNTDPYDIYETYAKRVLYVHVSDMIGVNKMAKAYSLMQQGNSREEVFKKMKTGPTNLGQGEIDQKALLTPLLNAGFDGWLIIEGKNPNTSPLKGIQIATNYLKKELSIPPPHN